MNGRRTLRSFVLVKPVIVGLIVGAVLFGGSFVLFASMTQTANKSFHHQQKIRAELLTLEPGQRQTYAAGMLYVADAVGESDVLPEVSTKTHAMLREIAATGQIPGPNSRRHHYDEFWNKAAYYGWGLLYLAISTGMLIAIALRAVEEKRRLLRVFPRRKGWPVVYVGFMLGNPVVLLVLALAAVGAARQRKQRPRLQPIHVD